MLKIMGKARIFLLVDLREKIFRFRVGGTKKKKKKSSENDQSIIKKIKKRDFFSYFFFSDIPRTNSKTIRCKTNSQLSVLTVSLYKKNTDKMAILVDPNHNAPLGEV